jgi:hypothetical protein
MEKKWYDILNILEKYSVLSKKTRAITHINKKPPNNHIYKEIVSIGLLNENEKIHFWRSDWKGETYYISLLEDISPKKVKEIEDVEIEAMEYKNYKRTKLIDKILNDDKENDTTGN